MITSIRTDRQENSESFDVMINESENETVNGHECIKFEIRQPGIKTWKHFVFQLLTVDEKRRMVFMIDNQNLPEFTSKGIVKAMIKACSDEYNCDIVSSSNLSHEKLDEREGRIGIVTSFWKKWASELDNVEYLKNEDRFIYKRLINNLSRIDNSKISR